MSKRYHIITFGCQMNKSDSERIARVLEKMGYKKVKKEETSDIIVVNMCSVRQSAVDRVYGLTQKLKKLKAHNPRLKTILTGCILKEDRKRFAEKFDLILNIKDLKNWPRFIKKGTAGKSLLSQSHYNSSEYLKIRPKYQNRFSVFIPISTGCNNACTYCAVPFTRGPLICREAEDILKEAREAVKKGAKEIWLLGQNVNDYCSKSKTKGQGSKIIDFARLLEMIDKIKGNFWIRFTSPNPADFSDKLIETMARCKKITPYLNLPVQSGDDKILKKMNRRYTVKEYKKLVKKIRSAFRRYRKGLEKEIALSTDIIVGFPGETKKQFQNTAELLKEIGFDMAYIARYSPRPGTQAKKMKDNVSDKEKRRREKELGKILRKTILARNKKFIGKSIEVLAEKSKNDYVLGKSRHFKTVRFKGDKALIGNFVKIKITKAQPFGLEGKISS